VIDLWFDMLARWLHVVGNVVFFIHRKSNTTSSKSIIVCEHLRWSKLDNVTKATRHAKSDRFQIELCQKGVSASNAKKPSYNLFVVQFPYDISLSANTLIPSNDEKRRLMFETVPPRCFPLGGARHRF
jgi:hypothetical protein